MNLGESTILRSTIEEQEYVKGQLIEFNTQHVPIIADKKPIYIGFNIKVSDGKIIAGINGVLYWGHSCLHIHILWVDEMHRKHDLGSKLLHHMESEAIHRGVHMSHLETLDFQAKDFYLKYGYDLFGVLDDCPKGHTTFYLKKDLC